MALKPNRTAVILLLLVGVTLAVYWRVTGFEFVNYDDPEYVTNNPVVKAGLTRHGFTWAFTSTHAANWHPVTWLSHMADCERYGLNAGKHHLTNLALHIVNALLLFGIMRRLTGVTWQSAFAAALFAWHPMHVESVAWISERKDVLSTFFWLLTLGAYGEYAGTSKQPGFKSRLFYCLALGFFALGLMSKPMLVTLPFVLVLLDIWPLKRFGTARMLEKAPFFLLSAADCAVTVFAQRAGGAVNPLSLVSLSDRFANAVISYVRYLGKMVWPGDLAVVYPREHWSAWQTSGAVGLLVVITALAVLRLRREPYILVGWLWFLGTLVPVIGLVQVGVQSMADRYSYIPLIGIFIVIAWLLGDLVSLVPAARKFAFAAIGVWLAILVFLTGRQVRVWQNTFTLFSHATAVTTHNSEAEDNLGMWFLNQGKLPEAMNHFKTSLGFEPGSYATLLHIGVTSFRMGRPREAEGWIAMSLRARPEWTEAHFYLASLLASQGRLDEAIPNYQAALGGDPANAQTRDQLGQALARRLRVREAMAEFNEAVRLEPGNPQYRSDQALAWVMLGNPEAAIQSYRETIRLSPDWPPPLNDLAWILATHPRADLRNGPKAVRLAERACQLSQRKEPRYLGTLDAAYAEAGRFKEAIATAQLAQKLALAGGQKDLAAAAKTRLDSYRAGRPFHQ